ncbi:unnamed protein product [Sphagnum jensenii]|uniref:adenylate kinase n=2 Tax=Sphagnum jensenii TaxID=128206 RepID=A0ABP0XHI6_9BRYO
MGSSSSKHHLKENCLDPSEVKKKPVIFVLGGPGSGKGTQCDKLAKDFGLQHLSLGDLLRDEVKQGSKIGRESSKLMAEGKLVPTSVSLELLKKAMCTSSSRDCQGYLIDGFPRAVDQATAFHKEVKKPDMVIYLHAPYDVLEKRLLKRGETSGRSDDNTKIIQKRFLTFRKETLPVVALYTSVLKRISSKPPSDEVYNKVHRTVEKLVWSCTQPSLGCS